MSTLDMKIWSQVKKALVIMPDGTIYNIQAFHAQDQKAIQILDFRLPLT